MRACLSCESGFLSLTCGELDLRRPLDVAALADFARRYAIAREHGDAPALLALGRDLRTWFDAGEDWLVRLRDTITPPLELEIRGPRTPNADTWTVLHAPWELLADEQGFLAEDDTLRYAPARRLGAPTPPRALDDYRLGIAFTAGAPIGVQELDFEAEEAAILNAAGQTIDLFVEESGDPEQLGPRLVALTPSLPVLHLSCHGHNAWKGPGGKGKPQPVVMLEDPVGAERPTSAEALIEALGAYKPRFMFVSACLTAAAGQAPGGATVLADSLATGLIRQGVPAVLGWEGSVADAAATEFAHVLYRALGARRLPLAEAAAAARRVLLAGGNSPTAGGAAHKDAEHKDTLGGAALARRVSADPDILRRDWHLARVWLGPEGGRPVVGGRDERSFGSAASGSKILLTARGNDKLEVASPAMFVGRRRELQRALRDLQDHGALLLHGMGRLGKSSLAARIADRRPDLTFAVVHAHYDALSVVEALYDRLEDHDEARALLEARRPRVRKDPAALRPLLVDLLAGPCKGAKTGQRPVLLLIDDLEQILQPDPKGGRHTVRLAERSVIAALLNAFTPDRGHSRLLFTSRFPFILPDGGRDLAAPIATLELSEFTGTARRKLALRQARAAALPAADLLARLPLLADAEDVARGNPGLQDLLGAGFVLRAGVPEDRSKAVLAEMAAYLEGGDLPRTENLREFLENLAVSELLALAGDAGRKLARAMTLFHEPVPYAAVDALADAVGGDPARLRDLGLLVPAADPVTPGAPAWSANGIAAGRQPSLTDPERQVLAASVLPALFDTWGGLDGSHARPEAADVELTRLAVDAGDFTVARACAGYAVRALGRSNPADAGALGQAVIELLKASGDGIPLGLLARTADVLRTAGDGAAADAVLALGGDLTAEGETGLDDQQLSNFLFSLGNRQAQAGTLDVALSTFERLCALEIRRGDEHQLAVARGCIADILRARGDLDEALRIRREDEIPVYTRLGDVRSIAITQRKTADILRARGDLDEALRILREEALPIHTRLGEVRSIAITQGSIADCLQARGDLDEALRIRREDEIPVYTRLGDVRSIAVTQGQIADILQDRGDLDEALRTYREEALPIHTRLGEVRSIAITQSRIADILQARGDLDEALRIRREDEIPVYTRLGDVRSIAVAQGNIADILQARGDLDEALLIRREDEIPVYTLLGDIDGIAAAHWGIAQIHLARQDAPQAFEPLQEAWTLFLRLGRADGIAIVGECYGQFLAVTEPAAALEVFRQSAAAFRKLGRNAEADKVDVLLRDLDSP